LRFLQQFLSLRRLTLLQTAAVVVQAMAEQIVSGGKRYAKTALKCRTPARRNVINAKAIQLNPRHLPNQRPTKEIPGMTLSTVPRKLWSGMFTRTTEFHFTAAVHLTRIKMFSHAVNTSQKATAAEPSE
jgi:hypothetical protein